MAFTSLNGELLILRRMLPFDPAGEYEKARALLDDLKEVINTLKGVHGRLFDGRRQ